MAGYTPTNDLFISERFLKDNTPFNNAIDVSELLPHIKEAQDIYIQDVLGSKLYNTLKSQVAGEAVTPGTLTSAQIELLKMIRPSLAYYTYYEALPTIYMKVRSKGIMKGTADTSTSVEFTEMKYLREEAKSKAQYYIQRLQEYLLKYGQLFPDYISSENPISPNFQQGYTCDLALDQLDGPSANSDFSVDDLIFYKKYIR